MISEAPADFSRTSVRSLLIFALIGGFLAAISMMMVKAANGPAYWYAVIFLGFLCAIPLAWAMRQCFLAGTSLRQLLAPWPDRSDWPAALVILPLYILLSGLGLLEAQWFSKLWSELAPPKNPLTPSAGLYTFQIVFMVAVTLLEEIVFRGVILRRWACKWGVPRALLFSSLLCGLCVFSLESAVLGYFLGLLYLRSGSLWLPIAVHAVWSFQAMFLPYQLSNLGGWPAGLAYFFSGAILLWLMRSLYLPRLPLALPSIPLTRTISISV